MLNIAGLSSIRLEAVMSLLLSCRTSAQDGLVTASLQECIASTHNAYALAQQQACWACASSIIAAIPASVSGCVNGATGPVRQAATDRS